MSREESLLKNTAVLLVGTFLPKLVALITLPILTGCLTKDEYGTYDLVLVIVALFLPAVTLQVHGAAFRFLIDCRGDKGQCNRIISTIFVFAISLSILAVIAFFFIWKQSSVIVKVLICIYFLIDIVSQISKQCIRGLGQNVKFSIATIVGAVMQMVLALVLVLFLNLGFVGSLIALVGSECMTAVYLLFGTHLHCYINPKNFRLETLKKLLSYSWPTVPNGLSLWVMSMSNRLLITMYMGVAANAVFAAANKIPQIVTLAQSTFTMAWHESASIASMDEDRIEYYSHIYKLLFDFLSGSAALLIGIGPMLFSFLVKGDYEEGIPHLSILIVGNLFYGMSAYLGGIYVAFFKTKSIGITTIVAASLNLLLSFILIPLCGLYGASLSCMISYLLLWAYRLKNVQKFQPLMIRWKRSAVVLAFLSLMVIIAQFDNNVAQVINVLAGLLLFFILCKGILHNLILQAGRKIRSMRG